eukprot:m.207233 g.207233  ORF g.207233 m.207233 type:complete len:85 (+) comp13761_c1_seq2:357-611(+)
MIEDSLVLATGAHLVTCSTDQTLRLWRLSDDGRYHNQGMISLRMPVRSMCLLKDGRIAVCSYQNTINVLSWAKIISAHKEEMLQ